MQRENDLRSGEIATAVLLPSLDAGTTSTHLRDADKLSFDWPIADVAVRLERDETARCRRVAVVLGAAAPVPQRARVASRTSWPGKQLTTRRRVRSGRRRWKARHRSARTATNCRFSPLWCGGRCYAPRAKDEEASPC